MSARPMPRLLSRKPWSIGRSVSDETPRTMKPSGGGGVGGGGANGGAGTELKRRRATRPL